MLSQKSEKYLKLIMGTLMISTGDHFFTCLKFKGEEVAEMHSVLSAPGHRGNG